MQGNEAHIISELSLFSTAMDLWKLNQNVGRLEMDHLTLPAKRHKHLKCTSIRPTPQKELKAALHRL